MRGGKYYFSGVKRDAPPKFDHKSPNSRSKKTSAARRKTVKRQPVFKSDNWYDKAALSMTIRREVVTSVTRLS